MLQPPSDLLGTDAGVDALIDVFERVCAELGLDMCDDVLPRRIARTIILARMDGEGDPDQLYARALKAATH